MINFDALFKISYGLYILTPGDKNRGNGFISNIVFQVISEPAKFAVLPDDRMCPSCVADKSDFFEI
jgi:hypothetical protein